MEEIPDASRTLDIGDYARMLRRQWVVIVLITVVAGAAALAYSLRQPPVYQAQSAVAFQDLSRDLDIAGIPTPAAQTATEIAAQNVNLITSPGVLARVARAVNVPLQTVTGDVSAQVESTSPLVTITAQSSSAQQAARLANVVAAETVRVSNRQARATFSAAERSLNSRINKGVGNATTRQQLQDQLSRLQLLSTFATDASIAGTATPPGAAVSPKPARNTVLGLLLGLLIGLVVALIRNSLDRRVEGARDLAHIWSFPVVGQLRSKALGRVAYISSNGSDYDTALDLEAHRIVRGNLEFLDPRITLRTVLVTSAAPEEGKTTVAASLAAVNAAAGKRTLLIECDLRRPVLAGRLGVQPKPGLSEVLNGTVSLEQAVQVVPVTEPSNSNGSGPHPGDGGSSLVCLTAGSARQRAAELLESAEFRALLERVAQDYDMVVLDTSPLLAVVDTLELLSRVDGVVLCVRAQRTTRDQVEAVKNILGRFPEKPTGVVITGIRPRGADQVYGPYSYQYA